MDSIVVDPVTRIEGHLRIEAVVEKWHYYRRIFGRTMVRPREDSDGRDPRDAWAITERVSGFAQRFTLDQCARG